jgi:precorrin-3B synthase
VNAPLARGACPTLAAPMQTGDGLLARLNPVASGLSPAEVVGLCQAALRHGNGIVEVTARGSFQIRGLSAASAAMLAADVDALGIAVRSGVPVETGPLAGLDPHEIVDPMPLAELIRRGIAAAGLEGRLGPKVSVVVDGGGSWMGEVKADIRLTALGSGVWRLAVGGDAATARKVGAFAQGDAAAVAVAVLGEVAALGRWGRAGALTAGTLMRVVAVSAKPPRVAPPSVLPDISPSRGEIGPRSKLSPSSDVADWRNQSGRPISPLEGEMSGRTEGGAVERGVASGAPIPLTDSRLAVPIALPFGHCSSATLIDLTRATETLGASEIRLAPKRTLLFLLPSQPTALQARDTARHFGFVVDSSDPRARIAACPGSPACASGHVGARAIAAEIAAVLPPGEALDLHVSGCEKRCAKPGHDGITLLGEPRGVALVLGNAEAKPLARVAHEQAVAAIGRVARLIAAERKPGERESACLARIGAPRLAKAFTSGLDEQ